MRIYNMYFELLFVATTLFETSLSQSGDVVIVIDDLKNITDAYWAKLQFFIASLIENFRICSLSEIHAGVVMSTKLIGNFTRLIPTRRNETLEETVNALEKPTFTTDLSSDIKTARRILNKHGRKGAMPLIVIITDGYLEHPEKTTQEVKRTKSRRITIVATGFGLNVSLGGLNKIASSSEHVFMVHNSTYLKDELQYLIYFEDEFDFEFEFIAANKTGYFICETIFESVQHINIPLIILFPKRNTSGFHVG